MATRKINTVEEIRKIEGRVYVRWSNSFAKDAKRGYSLRYGTQAEAGISACEIDKTWEDWRILRQIREYEFVYGKHCWIITGDEIGRGGDNEPLLGNIELIGEIGESLLDADWVAMYYEAMIAKDEVRLQSITNQIAINITIREIENNKKKLAQHLANPKPYLQ
jgi:hypothetical protein